MYKARTFEEKMHRHEVRMRFLQSLALETRCFYLERRLRRLENEWGRSSPNDERRLRKERLQIRHEFEMLKIDIETLERRARPLLKPRPQ
jgi:hypothetical protein